MPKISYSRLRAVRRKKQRKFENKAIGSGEGAQVYGWGHYVAGARETAEAYKKNIASPGTGSLYHIQVRPDESELLDWDKSLMQQSPQVKAALEPLGISAEHANLTGEQLYRALGQPLLAKGEEYQPKVSEALHNAGVPGIKYLDQFSRGKPDDPSATRNYVIFHPDNLKIVGRNGQEAPAQLEQIDHDPFGSSSSAGASHE